MSTAKDVLKDAMSSPIGATGTEDPRPAVKVGERHDGLHVELVYDDLRQWVAAAEKLGEIRLISGASWQRVHFASPLSTRSLDAAFSGSCAMAPCKVMPIATPAAKPLTTAARSHFRLVMVCPLSPGDRGRARISARASSPK